MPRKPETRCMRCPDVSVTRMPSQPSAVSGRKNRRRRNWNTATARKSRTVWMQLKLKDSGSRGNLKNWSVPLPNQESISMHMLTETVLQETVKRVTEVWAIPHRTSLHVTLKRFSEGAMNGRKLLKADWVSKTRKQRKLKESTGLIP